MLTKLESMARIPLAQLPTPLELMPRLGKALGLQELYVKRDDLTGTELGGNKARKLEYEFAQIVRQKCDVVITTGGPQSNHARITAAFARKLGIETKLVLTGDRPADNQGNLLLNSILGAQIRFVPEYLTPVELNAQMEKWKNELLESGRNPYLIPLGASTGLGALGYVRAMSELLPFFGRKEVQILLAVGSCGTLAGAVLGAEFFLPFARVIGISVSRKSRDIATRTIAIMKESSEYLHCLTTLKEDDLEIYDDYYGEYGKLTPSGKEALLLAGRTEGLLLDPIYTAKAMAGLCDLARRGVLKKEVPTVFVHTGGLPITFAFSKELS